MSETVAGHHGYELGLSVAPPGLATGIVTKSLGFPIPQAGQLDASDPPLPIPRLSRFEKAKLVGQAEVPRISLAESGLGAQLQYLECPGLPHLFPSRACSRWSLTPSHVPCLSCIAVQPTSSCSSVAPVSLPTWTPPPYSGLSNSGLKSRHYSLSLRAQSQKMITPHYAQGLKRSPHKEAHVPRGDIERRWTQET